MARVRVLIYRDQSDEVIEDFIVEDLDKDSYRVADIIKQSVPDENYVGDTSEVGA